MINRPTWLLIPLLISTCALAETWSPWTHNASFGGPFSGNYTQFQQRQVPVAAANFISPSMGFYPSKAYPSRAQFNRGHNWQNQNFSPVAPYANSQRLFSQQQLTN